MAEDPGQIRAAIEETRREIADTVQALGEKADVKARMAGAASAQAEAVRDRVGSVAQQAKASLPEAAQPVADRAIASARVAAGSVAEDPARQRALMAAVAAVLFVVVVRRRRRAKRGRS